MKKLPNPLSIYRFIETKIEIPQLCNPILPRKNCQKLLDLGMNRQLSLITGPTGYGKTTLLADWLASRARPTGLPVWIGLDAYDNSVFQFWPGLISAIRKAFPTFQLSTQQFLRFGDGLNDLNSLNPLINAIWAIPSPVYLVLDDYHEITNPMIHNGMQYFIEHQPKNLHLYISSRSSIPLRLSILREREQLVEISTRHLSLSLDETRAFLIQIKQVQIPASQISRLYQATEGWIAGLILAAYFSQDPSQISGQKISLTENYPLLMQYFVEEVLGKQEAKVRDFLLQTSVLTEFCPYLCDFLLDRSDSREMIDQLEQQNLFIQPLDQAHTCYRYHPLFAACLNSLLKRSQPEIIPFLHRKAIDWLVDHGYHDKAVIHTLAVEDYDFAGKILSDWSMEAIRTLNLVSLVNWIKTIPEDFIYRYPNLGIKYALANHLMLNPEKVEPALQRVEKALSDLPDAGDRQAELERYRWEIAAIRMVSQIGVPAHEFAIQDMENLLASGPEQDSFYHGLLNHTIAELYEGIYELDMAAEHYRRGIQIGSKTQLYLEQAHSMCALARVFKLQGQLSRSENTYREAIDLVDRHGLEVSTRLYAQSGILEIEIERAASELDHEIVQEIEQNYALIQNSPLPNHYFILLTYRLIKYYLYIRNAAKAQEYYQNIKKVNDKHFLISNYPEIWELEYLLKTTRGKDAVDRSWHSRMIQDGMNHPDPSPVEQIVLARCLLDEQQTQPAHNLLQNTLLKTKNNGCFELFLQAMILLSLVKRSSGEELLAHQGIEQALQLAANEGYIWPFIWGGQGVLSALESYRDRVMDNKPDWMTSKTYRFLSSVLSACQNAGELGVPGEMERTNFQALIENKLSAREMEVLRLLYSEKSTKEVAALLMVSPNTAKAHIRSVYRKIGVHTHSEVVRKAREMEIIPYSDEKYQ